jgi:hypothetical protein
MRLLESAPVAYVRLNAHALGTLAIMLASLLAVVAQIDMGGFEATPSENHARLDERDPRLNRRSETSSAFGDCRVTMVVGVPKALRKSARGAPNVQTEAGCKSTRSTT